MNAALFSLDGAATDSRRRRGAVRQVLLRACRSSLLAARLLAAYDRRLDLGRGVGWSALGPGCASPRSTSVSVDVFDTVLSRQVVGDHALWWAVGTSLVRAGAWSASVEEFVHAREVASEAVPNGTLEAVYAQAVLARRLDGSGVRCESLLERELTVPLSGASEGLQRLREGGHQLTFVSDMHLSEKDLWACLAEHGLASAGDQLVVSSAEGASKWEGTLFPVLARKAAPRLEWHIGNDLWSDVAMAERAGVRAVALRKGEATRLESTMARRPGSMGAAVAGAALRVRSGGKSDGLVQEALWEVGADVAGQCLSAFLLWIREQCERAGVRRIVFLARDGELPLLMALAMPDDHWDGFRLTYLQGNRRLWAIAAAAALGVEAWLAAGTADAAAFLRQGENRVPWGSLIGRVALDTDDLVRHPHLNRLPLGAPLPVSETPAWLGLLEDDQVRRTIAERAGTQYHDVREYLTSEGLGAERVAVVDVGWRGQLAWHVSAVLRDVTGFEPMHLHFGGVDVASDEAEQVDIRRFAMDDSKEELPFPDVVSCVETLTASGKPRAKGVQRNSDGVVHPVFDDALPDMDTQHRRLMRRSAVEVAGALPSRAALARLGLQLDGLDRDVRAVLGQFWLHPERRHALAAMHLAAEVDDAGAVVHPVARPYAVLGRGRTADRTWRQGSLRLTGPLLRVPFALALRAADRRDGWRRRL